MFSPISIMIMLYLYSELRKVSRYQMISYCVKWREVRINNILVSDKKQDLIQYKLPKYTGECCKLRLSSRLSTGWFPHWNIRCKHIHIIAYYFVKEMRRTNICATKWLHICSDCCHHHQVVFPQSPSLLQE